MTSEIIEIFPGQNLPQTITQADYADNFFIGTRGKLMQWSVSQRKVTKDHGDIMTDHITGMVQTSDKKYLFLSDDEGS
jgi:WD40 repeat protein